MKKINIGIIGASGFTGLELIRLLQNHSNVVISDVLNSESFEGKNVADYYSGIKINKKFSNFSIEEILEKNLDLIFFATPNGIAMNQSPKFLEKGIKVIDLSSDFRFENVNIFESVYSLSHPNKDLKGIYGLPEIGNYEIIKNANLIANPGCYVTSGILGLYPVSDLIDHVIIDGKSGWSGAGRKANPKDYEENFVPYKLTGHRHEYEMKEKLNIEKLFFTPGVLSFFRGIVNTIHIFPKKGVNLETIKNKIKIFYKNKYFVEVIDEIPNLKDVQNTNKCIIGGFSEKDSRIVFVSMIDNLIKGASGQAIQNMNLMFGFDEKISLI